MREIFRVLDAGGSALIMVPMLDGPTIEDPNENDPEERLRRFGQRDHVRLFGMDIEQRLEAAGFEVETIRPDKVFEGPEFERYGLRAEGLVFWVKKPECS